MPFFRSDAPSREKTPYLPSSVVITSFTIRELVIMESTMAGFVGSLTSMAYTRSAMVRHVDALSFGCTHTSAPRNVTGTRPYHLEPAAHLRAA